MSAREGRRHEDQYDREPRPLVLILGRGARAPVPSDRFQDQYEQEPPTLVLILGERS